MDVDFTYRHFLDHTSSVTRLQTKEFTIDVSDPKSDRSNYYN
jgi:hypothetical protein